MCIRKVEAWAFGDKTFDHEIDATKAAIESIIGNAGVSKIVFEKADKLLPLLDRFAELQAEAAAGKVAPETDGKDPKVPMEPAAVRELLADTMRAKAKKNKAWVQGIITKAGYADLGHLLDRASDMHVVALLARITESQVGRETLDAQDHAPNCNARLSGYESDCSCGWLVRHKGKLV